MYKINTTFDCPGFQGLYNFCQLSVGGSLDAADLIITGESHFAVNWGGGLHHAKKSEASGFCYVNDIVVCILELLKVYPRVLYLDIDVHHGDGVEEAFYHTNRVMTVSFHQYEDEFFPGTGDVTSIGEGYGKYYTINVPLKKGISDSMYFELFKKVMSLLMGSYRPDVLVFQSGADSLSKDRIGNFDLSISVYGQCVKFMKGFNVPMILLGGGGYTVENVARCWAYETSVLINENIGNEIPKTNEFAEYYQDDDYKLHFPVNNAENQNQQKDLDRIYQTISEHIREAEVRPSIVFHYAPKHFLPGNQLEWKMVEEEEENHIEEENLFKSFK